jgi:hypothetical protein
MVYLGDELGGSVPRHRAAGSAHALDPSVDPLRWLHAPVTTASRRAGATIGHG